MKKTQNATIFQGPTKHVTQVVTDITQLPANDISLTPAIGKWKDKYVQAYHPNSEYWWVMEELDERN